MFEGKLISYHLLSFPLILIVQTESVCEVCIEFSPNFNCSDWVSMWGMYCSTVHLHLSFTIEEENTYIYWTLAHDELLNEEPYQKIACIKHSIFSCLSKWRTSADHNGGSDSIPTSAIFLREASPKPTLLLDKNTNNMLT